VRDYAASLPLAVVAYGASWWGYKLQNDAWQILGNLDIKALVFLGQQSSGATCGMN